MTHQVGQESTMVGSDPEDVIEIVIEVFVFFLFLAEGIACLHILAVDLHMSLCITFFVG